MKRGIVCLLALALAFGGMRAGAAQAPLYIVTTTTMLTDLAQSIGGTHVRVEGLMGPGIDPHLYKASAQDVLRLQESALVVFHGLHLEGRMGDVFRALDNRGKRVLEIGRIFDESELLYTADGQVDPHVWFDVQLWKKAAVAVADTLIALDPAHETDYRLSLERLIGEMDALEPYIRERIGAIVPDGRVLVTAHDAFGYMGRAYGLRVEALQGISTDTEAGTADVMALAAYIAEQGIPAIFTETSISPKTMEALRAAVASRGVTVNIGGSLYADSLGDAQSGCADYCATVKANIDTIADALGATEASVWK